MSQRIYGGQIVKVVKQRCQPHFSFFTDKSVTIVLFEPPKDLTDKQMLAQYGAAVTSTDQKVKTFKFLGLSVNRIELPATTSARRFRAILANAATDLGSVGIIVQNPVPQNKLRVEIAKIPTRLDIDGINPASIFKASATSEAISRLVMGFGSSGDCLAVVGSMGFVGSGVVELLKPQDIQIVELDKRKGDTDGKIKRGVREADLVVTVTGKANLIQSDYLKPEHKLVIDGAFIPQSDGTILGDICKDAYNIPEYLTPVPGGVGPTQMAVLLERIMKVAQIEIQPWDYRKDVLEPLKREQVAEISFRYKKYSFNVKAKGLLGAKEIAKNALADEIKLEQVAQMLTDNNLAYQELIAQSSPSQAKKIVTKARAELITLKNNRSDEMKSSQQDLDRGQSR